LVFENGNDAKTEGQFQSFLIDKTLESVHRKGKYMWFAFAGSKPAILFHFGMTGSFVVKDVAVLTHKTAKISGEPWPPKFTKLRIVFDNDCELVFVDQRRFARIKLRNEPLAEPPISELGIDPFAEELPSADTLVAMLSKYSSPIKSVLLDQNKVFCGIGNWVVDEVLYQAAVHPATPANEVDATQAEAILNKLSSILSIAIERNVDAALFPPDWLFQQRWKRNSTLPDGRRITVLFVDITLFEMFTGTKIVFEQHGGRNTGIVPSVQIRSKKKSGIVSCADGAGRKRRKKEEV
jgi:formamidopyrimidine-DNA glycosylase